MKLQCLFFCCVVSVLLITPNHSAHETQPKERIVVEVAIVCDKQFSSAFVFSRPKIIAYWKAFFYDLHLRFKTLPRTSISFRITSVTIIKDIEEQPFIEAALTKKGKVNIRDAHMKFSQWIYRKMRSLPKFDIAIAATGVPYTGKFNAFSFVGGACDILHENGENVVLSTLAVSMRTAMAVKTVAYEIAHLLGVIHDSNPEPLPKDYKFDFDVDTGVCLVNNPNDYIMEADTTSTPYVFSECTQRDISAFIRAPRTKCLRKINSKSEPIFGKFNTSFSDTSALISIVEQCRIRASNPGAFVRPEDEACSMTRCSEIIQEGKFAGMVQAFDFSPFDGSPCRMDGRCFRGLCRAKTETIYRKYKSKDYHSQ